MKQNKQTVKLNESQLRQVIKESIKKVLNEGNPSGLPAYFRGTDREGNFSVENVASWVYIKIQEIEKELAIVDKYLRDDAGGVDYNMKVTLPKLFHLLNALNAVKQAAVKFGSFSDEKGLERNLDYNVRFMN